MAEELTVEKIKEITNRGEEYRAQFKRSMTMGWVEFELFDGLLDSVTQLLTELANKERETAEKCVEITKSDLLFGCVDCANEIEIEIKTTFGLYK